MICVGQGYSINGLQS